MILRPTREDLKLICWTIGRVILGIGLIMLVPLVVALVCTEWVIVLDFLTGILACVAFWLLMENTCYVRKDLTWMHGLVVASAILFEIRRCSSLPVAMNNAGCFSWLC